jgi:hypothetical protein
MSFLGLDGPVGCSLLCHNLLLAFMPAPAYLHGWMFPWYTPAGQGHFDFDFIFLLGICILWGGCHGVD